MMTEKDRKTYLQFREMADDLRQAESWGKLDGVLNRNKTMQNLHEMGYRKRIRGQWVFNRRRKVCSICRYPAPYKKIEVGYHLLDASKFCPGCGAEMVENEG